MSEREGSEVMRDRAEGLSVGDAMLASPKALPAESTIGDLRTAFENSHLRTALVVDGSSFIGVVERGSVLADTDRDDRSVTEIADRDIPTVTPEIPLSEALRILDDRGDNRLPVLDPDGRTLLGLLCLTSNRESFCR